jgi:hypothetical protein
MEIQQDKPIDDLQRMAFNGSVDTLKRIDELIIHVQIYSSNFHTLGFKENLRLLLYQCRGFLTKVERKKARKDWDEIEKLKLVINDDGTFTEDEELRKKLLKIFEWLQYKLVVHEITMVKRADFDIGIDKAKSRYGLV